MCNQILLQKNSFSTENPKSSFKVKQNNKTFINSGAEIKKVKIERVNNHFNY